MRILLVISISNILKINSGGSQRNALFAKALAKVGQVDIICFTEDDITLDIPNCKVLFSKEMYRHSTLKDSLRTLIGTAFQPSSPYSYFTVDKKKEAIIDHFVKKGNYDVIATRYIDKAIEGGLLKYRDKLIIDADDNLSNVFQYKAAQAQSKIERWKKHYQSRRVGLMTEKLLDSVWLSFYSNPTEKPSARSVFLHNTTTTIQPVSDIAETTRPRILFVGTLMFPPSQQGAAHFAEAIFPIIRRSNPAAELQVVGRGEPDFLAYLNHKEGVTAVGRVEDLAAEYEQAAVVVIPVYSGSGTSVKFIEAMLMNRPVVSSPMGARGFNEIFQDNTHYMLANTDEEFASKTLELLSSVQKSQAMAKRGFQTAKEYFSQERFEEIVKVNIQTNEMP